MNAMDQLISVSLSSLCLLFPLRMTSSYLTITILAASDTLCCGTTETGTRNTSAHTQGPFARILCAFTRCVCEFHICLSLHLSSLRLPVSVSSLCISLSLYVSLSHLSLTRCLAHCQLEPTPAISQSQPSQHEQMMAQVEAGESEREEKYADHKHAHAHTEKVANTDDYRDRHRPCTETDTLSNADETAHGAGRGPVEERHGHVQRDRQTVARTQRQAQTQRCVTHAEVDETKRERAWQEQQMQ